MRVRSVLIAGAGIAGLSLAIALREKGIPARVVEKRSESTGEGTGLHLPGNAVRAATKLGLEDALRRSAFRIPKIEYTDQTAENLATLDLTKRYGPTASWPPFLALHRKTFHEILLTRAQGININYDCEVVSIGRDEQGVGVTLSNGEVECPDLLVGADGINSTTRINNFGPDATPRDLGYHCWRFVVRCPNSLTTPQYMIGDRRAFLAMPIGGGDAYCYAMICSDALEDHQEHLNDLSQIFEGFGGVVPVVLARSDPDSMISDTLKQVSLERWSIGRIVLIGDAAHATLPTLAQGAAMAMEDALSLADQLGAGQGSLEDQLGKYEARRRPRVTWVQRQSVKRMKVVAMQGQTLQSARDFILKGIGGQILKSGWAPLIDKPF